MSHVPTYYVSDLITLWTCCSIVKETMEQIKNIIVILMSYEKN
jgi:ABC-type uncharacterized transport system substrate-binding protein